MRIVDYPPPLKLQQERIREQLRIVKMINIGILAPCEPIYPVTVEEHPGNPVFGRLDRNDPDRSAVNFCRASNKGYIVATLCQCRTLLAKHPDVIDFMYRAEVADLHLTNFSVTEPSCELGRKTRA